MDYEENFDDPSNHMFQRLDGSNNYDAKLMESAYDRRGILKIYRKWSGELAVAESNLITMRDNPFTHCRVLFYVYTESNSTVVNMKDNVCLGYTINDGNATSGCWDTSHFAGPRWFRARFEFELPIETKNMRLMFQVQGNNNVNDTGVYIDQVIIQGR